MTGSCAARKTGGHLRGCRLLPAAIRGAGTPLKIILSRIIRLEQLCYTGEDDFS